MANDAHQAKDKALRFIDHASELTGTVVGGVAGTLLGGGDPAIATVGAAAGSATASVLKDVGADVYDRALSGRQRVRAGAAFSFAVADIQTRLQEGQSSALNAFFTADDDHRSAAEELLEGVLLHAADCYEEKKVPFLGHLYASMAFDASLTRPHANLLLEVADDLRYRQMLFMEAIEVGAFKALESPRVIQRPSVEAYFEDDLAIDLGDLERLGLVHRGERGQSHVRRGMTFVDAAGSPPNQLNLTETGVRLRDLMRLDLIPEADLVQSFGLWASREFHAGT